MKLEFTFLLLAVATLGASLEENDRAWNNYKETYNKKYAAAEDVIRKNIFTRNKQSVDEHYELFIHGERSFFTGLNKFSDRLPYEMEKLRGFKKSEIRIKSDYTFEAPEEGVKFVSGIDWRLKGAVTSVKDQGQHCDSSWAFAAVGGLEAIYHRLAGQLISLSAQDLVDCDNFNNGCAGGITSAAFAYIYMNGGINSEENYPYVGKQQSCHFNRSRFSVMDVGFVNLPPRDEVILAAAVHSIGPISVNIDSSPQSFHSYSGGIYSEDKCDAKNATLSVLVVGFGVTSEGTDYWIIKNAWGTGWGEAGYMRIVRGKNMCGVAMEPSYPAPTILG